MTRESSTEISTPVQEITLEHIPADGLILDIGGGGEGLVSRIEGAKVCAIDIRMSEIREAQIHGPPANWFVGDGRSLCFRDDTFEVATLWFSLGYMSDWSIKRKVLEESYRVLRKNGLISIKASTIPNTSNRLIFWAHFTLPNGEISRTGYGVRGGQDQTFERTLDLVEEVGFQTQSSKDHKEWFEIRAIKA